VATRILKVLRSGRVPAGRGRPARIERDDELVAGWPSARLGRGVVACASAGCSPCLWRLSVCGVTRARPQGRYLGGKRPMVVQGGHELPSDLGVPSRSDVAQGPFEPRADARQRAEHPIELQMVARPGAAPQGGFPDEARGLETAGRSARRDLGELLGVEPKELGRGAAARGGHGAPA
jgi:hypothetical protein